MTNAEPAPDDKAPGRDSQKWADETFTPGERPSDDVVIDDESPDVPNIGHPE